jgi:dUTP pyrophosphatase
MKVRIHRLDPHVPLPAYHSAGAAAFDLIAREDTVVRPGEVRLVPTGLVVGLPAGHLLAIVARSSLPIRKGLMVANGVGIVDPDYSGPGDEVKVEVYNFTAADVRLARGERIAQGLVLACPRVEWEESAPGSSPSRGGFGATGGYE